MVRDLLLLLFKSVALFWDLLGVSLLDVTFLLLVEEADDDFEFVEVCLEVVLLALDDVDDKELPNLYLFSSIASSILAEGLIRTWVISRTRVLLLGNIWDFDVTLVLCLEVFDDLLELTKKTNLKKIIEYFLFKH